MLWISVIQCETHCMTEWPCPIGTDSHFDTVFREQTEWIETQETDYNFDMDCTFKSLKTCYIVKFSCTGNILIRQNVCSSYGKIMVHNLTSLARKLLYLERHKWAVLNITKP
jgi:hypothetical protein